ncbi:MAG: hypothetical protein RBR49_11920 [Desulfovibrio desulfuricans]|nr:hypothetical protein [Desulfovibrio desulfuricans]
MSNTTLTPLAERHYYVREKQFQITSEDVRSWLMEATRDRRKTTYELNFRIHRLGTALKAVEERAAELEAEAQILATWLANRELGISLHDQGCDADGGMGGPDPTLLRWAARKGVQKELEANHE